MTTGNQILGNPKVEFYMELWELDDWDTKIRMWDILDEFQSDYYTDLDDKLDARWLMDKLC